ncbi:APC family permease [Flavihumibacter petaseus]|uniref:Putative amino acid transporter n=1 Tax=Flavihumibacter petaseus NBRC 106054 TaxID=1220578 RepID=A0A0E9N3N3_9BACT|nr:amino acid permease [Flavihumibacter petaseus]GAO44592.1 putative amino acid transporter [Flavihumibacter petaseus NBRC 106054]
MANSLFRKKSIEKIIRDHEQGLADGHGGEMRKVLTVRDLTFMGIAAVIGAGIFSTIGSAAFDGGPGVIFLFLITAVTCGFTALCYAEFASRVPVSGSAYTYSYVTFGELVAWILGWALILEYSIGNIVVAISWSSYFNNILHNVFHINLPAWLTTGYSTASHVYQDALAAGKPVDNLLFTTAPRFLGYPFIINLPAFAIVCIITLLAYIGIKESKNTANFMVGLKICVLIFIAVVGIWVIFSNDTTSNWTPFLPNSMSGVLKGVSAVFFAYIGFDAISTTAEECANPQRDMPRGMINSLILCTLIYVVTTLVITGMVNYKEFEGVTDPLAFVFDKINMHKVGTFISISAVVAATSVMLVFQIGQPRIWMSMSRDGLLPKSFSRIHPKFQTPSFATIITGFVVGIPVLFADDKLMTDLTSIGTLFAFVLVCGGVLLLPRLEKIPGKFRLPYINGQWIIPALVVLFTILFSGRIADAASQIGTEGYQEILFLVFMVVAWVIGVMSFIRKYSLIPVLGMLCCLYLMIEIPAKSWLVFFGWMVVGLAIYFGYSYRRSRLA